MDGEIFNVMVPNSYYKHDLQWSIFHLCCLASVAVIVVIKEGLAW